MGYIRSPKDKMHKKDSRLLEKIVRFLYNVTYQVFKEQNKRNWQ